jgi:hypothetical protein
MSIHFAFARKNSTSPIARTLVRGPLCQPANDNRDSDLASAEQTAALQAALRHFARFGLGAASEARKQAETAFFTGDRKAYDWWLGICRTLDRRVARQLARQIKRD